MDMNIDYLTTKYKVVELRINC